MTLGFVFPGQGSQSVGMLGELAESHASVRRTFEEASDTLGYDLWALVREGPKEELDATERTQPALLTAGVACWRVWREQSGPVPGMLAGHSLGEYSALVAAGALNFGDAVSLVAFRGRAMQEAVPDGEGAMAAIIGLDDEAVSAACDEGRGEQVAEPVNFNAPGQVVVAGHRAAIERVAAIAEEKGARRAMMLPVSVPSHCALMRPAAERMAQRLADVAIAEPATPVLHNVDVETHSAPDEIRRALVAQLHSPVRWVETVRRMSEEGVEPLIECGPGKVLTGLNRRIERRMGIHPVFDPASLDKALAAVVD